MKVVEGVGGARKLTMVMAKMNDSHDGDDGELPPNRNNTCTAAAAITTRPEQLFEPATNDKQT